MAKEQKQDKKPSAKKDEKKKAVKGKSTARNIHRGRTGY